MLSKLLARLRPKGQPAPPRWTVASLAAALRPAFAVSDNGETIVILVNHEIVAWIHLEPAGDEVEVAFCRGCEPDVTADIALALDNLIRVRIGDYSFVTERLDKEVYGVN